jgi:hypothetical protein
MDVADRGLGEALALRGSFLVAGQAGDAVALQAAMERAAAELGDGVPEGAHDVIERQQSATPELDDDRLFGLGEDGAAGLTRPHGRVGGGRAGAPLGDGLGVQAVLVGQGAGRRLRRLEFGSNARRRSG